MAFELSVGPLNENDNINCVSVVGNGVICFSYLCMRFEEMSGSGSDSAACGFGSVSTVLQKVSILKS